MERTRTSTTKLSWDDEEVVGEAVIADGELVGVEIFRTTGAVPRSAGTFKVGKDGLSFVRAVYDACATILLEVGADREARQNGGDE